MSVEADQLRLIRDAEAALAPSPVGEDGRVVSGVTPVVKVQARLAASALPAASFAAVVIVAVYWEPPVSAAEGANEAVLPLTSTVPVTAVPPAFASLKLAVVSVEFVIASEKVADIEALVATLVAPFAGDVADTVGRVVSGAAAVVKFQV